MATKHRIPVIDVAPLLGGPSPARNRTDVALMEAAETFDFFAACGLPGWRASVARYYLAMEAVGQRLMRTDLEQAALANPGRGSKGRV